MFIPAQYTGKLYIIARTDPTNKVYEHNGENNNVTIREIEATLPLPADLIINQVTLPLEAIAGDVIEISWNTHNQGSNPAYGVYREIVYLSADSLWSADDLVFGIKDTTGYIPPLSTVSSTMSGPVKDVVEGLYYAVVQTDVRQQIIESDNNNNMSASLDRMEVEVKTLIIDSLMTDSLYLNQELYYKVNVLPGMEGESMIISLQGDSATGFNELYCKFGTVPSRGDFEFGPQQATGAFQHIIIPELQVGTYYIAGYGSMSTGEPQPIELLARIVPFEIHSISPKQGVKDTRVTVEIRGIKLDNTERLRLRQNNQWVERIAEQVFVFNENLVYATFDLTDMAVDTYAIDAVKADSTMGIIENGFRVIAEGNEELQINAFAPGIFWRAPRSASKIVITFINTGDVDIENAIVVVESPGGNLIAPTIELLRANE